MEQAFGLKMLKKIFLAFERFDKNALRRTNIVYRFEEFYFILHKL